MNKDRDAAVSSSCTMREVGSRGMRRILLYALLGVVGLAIAGLLRQRQRPIPIPPTLTFLFENPLVEAFAGSELLVERLSLAPGMQILDAGCGPGRLTIPVARAVEPTGEIVALDSQRAMLEELEHLTLAVEGDDFPARFYRSRDGDGQPPGTTACIQYPHAGGEAETLN